MEYKLFHYIMQPSIVATYISGIALSWILDWANIYKPYFHAKALCLLLMTIFHFSLLYAMRRFANGTNQYSHVFYRVLNEVPTVLMIAIVLLVKLH